MNCICLITLLLCVVLKIINAEKSNLKVIAYADVYPNVSQLLLNKTGKLYFGLVLSLSGDQQSTGALAGVQAALDDINNRDDLIPGYSLHYTLTDSQVPSGVVKQIHYY